MEVPELPTWCSSPARLQSTLNHLASFPIHKSGLSAWTSETLPRLAVLGDWSTDWETREPITFIHACFVGHILDGTRFVLVLVLVLPLLNHSSPCYFGPAVVSSGR